MKESHNILVVDDEQGHTMLISELLRRAGYTVAAANDPFKALAACKVRTPDLVILDLHMPFMGGMDVFERLRAEEKTAAIPIIFLGNKAEQVPVFKTAEPDSEDILFKPFEPNELLSRVRTLLRLEALKVELRQKEEQLSEMTLIDPVTDLKTQRYLTEFIKSGLKQARRYGVPLSVVVIEIDKHAELVQLIGQESTDKVISQLANLLGGAIRDSDIFVRTAEFEFVIVLTSTRMDGAIEVAERLRVMVEQNTFSADGRELRVTVSLGLCQFVNGMDDEGKILLSHAKQAVAQGHLSGGNITLKAE